MGKDTLPGYLAHLEDAFLVRTVALKSASERQRMVNPRKAYPVDPGLIALFERSGRSHHGRALETAVLIELERRGFEVAYVRTPEGFDVDFLAERAGERPRLIQACLESEGTRRSIIHDVATLPRLVGTALVEHFAGDARDGRHRRAADRQEHPRRPPRAWRDARIEPTERGHWRTAIAEEVDFVIETGGRLLAPEVKATARPRLADATHLGTFRAEYGKKARAGLLLHTGDALEWLASDVLAAPWWRVL